MINHETVRNEFKAYVDGFVECCTSDKETHELLKAVDELIDDLEERIAIMSEGDDNKLNHHEVACIIANLFGDPCACNFNGIDEWLPQHCDFTNTCCPNPVGVACWEQYLKNLDKKPQKEGNTDAEIY